ncbi:D-3-phosphoglycerate dehydrogenase [Candidatus Paraburkholderia calva]|nr:D-3-phosphoglycerate dehydrogenase [Candidatus Paraburkholderia calva]
MRQAIGRFAPDVPLWTLDDPRSSASRCGGWLPPAGAYAGLPNLRLIHSIGAGVNHILAEHSGGAIPLCRIVDPEQARIMAPYVLWGVLHFHRGMDRLQQTQRERRWLQFVHRPAQKTAVGVMGMGAKWPRRLRNWASRCAGDRAAARSRECACSAKMRSTLFSTASTWSCACCR